MGLRENDKGRSKPGLIQMILNILGMHSTMKNRCKLLERQPDMQHTGTMIRMTALLLAIPSCLGAGYAIWRDLTNSFSASASLGKMWYDHAPQSLQLAETIVSRYIDPCGLIEALDCTPVFWHPFISTLLGWPAALVLIGFTIFFGWLGTRHTRGGASRGKHRKSRYHDA